MSSVTSLTPLPYPDPTDQPFVHLDMKALAEATTESLYVVSSAAPAHKVGRRWHDSDDHRNYISDGTEWFEFGPHAFASYWQTGGTQTFGSGGAGTAVDYSANVEAIAHAYVSAPVAVGGIFTLNKAGVWTISTAAFIAAGVAVQSFVTLNLASPTTNPTLGTDFVRGAPAANGSESASQITRRLPAGSKVLHAIYHATGSTQAPYRLNGVPRITFEYRGA